MLLSRLKILILMFILSCTVNLYAAQLLTVKIEIPYSDSLIRGDIPVFGKAYGKDFKEFILDYGESKEPKEWTVINKSDIAQKEYKPSVGIDMTSFGKTIEGNLGTWDTGLDEYKYGKHAVNLSGTYTLRLRAFDNKGNVAEDKITIEVGRIILNSIGGKAQSQDGLASLEAKEHSLYTSALLVSLKSLDKNPFPQEGLTLASKIYELREPGEKFAQPVILKIKYSTDIDSKTLRIYSYDPQKKNWCPLNSNRNENEKTISAQITQIPDKFALYAIFSSNKKTEQVPPQEQTLSGNIKDEILFQNNIFKEGQENWHTKYSDIGANLSLAKKDDNTNCLKLANQASPSNFSSSIITGPFNAKEYQFIKFDYRIPKDLKINFQVKAGGKWYDIVFTDDEKICWDVNIEKIGKIENIIADNNWHAAYFNLYDMLKDKTNDFIIQEFTMADWDITGFMKLEFGNNKKGATFYIDNFIIAHSSSDLTARAWKAFDKKDFETSKKCAAATINMSQNINQEAIVNDIAACHFIVADILRIEGHTGEAREKYQFIAQNYPQAKCWDPRGWYWNVADVAKDRIFTLETGFDFGDYSSEYLTNKAWEGLDKKDYRQVEVYAQKCIYLYEKQAKSQKASLNDFAKDSFIPYYWSLNNVGTCYFILGEAHLAQKRYDDAKKMYQEVLDNYPYSRCWDLRGWFWKVSEVAKERLKKIK